MPGPGLHAGLRKNMSHAPLPSTPGPGGGGAPCGAKAKRIAGANSRSARPGPPGPAPRRPLRARGSRKLPGGGRDSSTGALFAHGPRSRVVWVAFVMVGALFAHGTPMARHTVAAVWGRRPPAHGFADKKDRFFLFHRPPRARIRRTTCAWSCPGGGRPRAPPCLGFRRAVWGSAAAPPPHTASPMPRASSTRSRPSRKIGTPRWCCACALRAPAPTPPPCASRPRRAPLPAPARRHAPSAGHEKRPDALRRRGAWVLRRPGG